MMQVKDCSGGIHPESSATVGRDKFHLEDCHYGSIDKYYSYVDSFHLEATPHPSKDHSRESIMDSPNPNSVLLNRRILIGGRPARYIKASGI